MCRTFLRFSEHSESQNPWFVENPFTSEEFLKWYDRQGYGWGYWEWEGFNITDQGFENFFTGLFDPLSHAEQELVSYFKDIPSPFCVIAIVESDPDDALNHEIAHAMFYLNGIYREEVEAILSQMPVSYFEEGNIRKYLVEMGGYNEKVILDEIHAYLLFGTSGEDIRDYELSFLSYMDLAVKLQEVFYKHLSLLQVNQP